MVANKVKWVVKFVQKWNFISLQLDTREYMVIAEFVYLLKVFLVKMCYASIIFYDTFPFNLRIDFKFCKWRYRVCTTYHYLFPTSSAMQNLQNYV